MNIKLTHEQAFKISNLIFSNGVRTFDTKEFSIDEIEFTNILLIAFNNHTETKAIKGIKSYYNKLITKK